MANELTPVNKNNVRPIDPLLKPAHEAAKIDQAGRFQELLKAKVGPEIKFSGHALERLQKRNIVLTDESIEKLKTAVMKAEEKGSRESLVLMDNLALIVSIKNHTVITTIDGERIKENVFTNIDSAIII